MDFTRDSNNNIIHKSVVIRGNPRLGKDNFFGPYCVVYDNVSIGDKNYFTSHVSIGSPAEHKDKQVESSDYQVIIGNHNIFREFITINKPTSQDSLTLIEDNCFIMRGCHVSHDTWIESNVTMSCDVILGGHSRIMKGAYMGIKSCTHPFTIIGAYCIAGMGAVITTDFGPGLKIIGIPAKDNGMNTIGLDRADVRNDELNNQVDRFLEAVHEKEN